MHLPAPTALAFLILASCWSPALLALRCSDGLITEGDRRYRIIDACGEPDFVDRQPVFVHSLGHAAPGAEEWYYNFGPQQLIKVLRLRNGRLQSVRTDGHGFSGKPPGACGPYDIRPSMSKFRLIWECGEPVEREGYFVYRPLDFRSPTGRSRPVLIEKWFYQFGPQHLDRKVELENGRVIDIDVPD